MKKYDICGIGNALVDILTDITEAEFLALELERGTMRLVDEAEQHQLLARVASKKRALKSGGSVANSIIALAQLGSKGALLCSLADDEFGKFYAQECKSLGIALPNPLALGEMTGTCAIFVTPDSERTMRTCLAASSMLSEKHADAATIGDSKWLFIEGYLVANPALGQGAVRAAIKAAKAGGTKIAFTCSEPWIISGFGDAAREVIEQADLVFTNEHEAMAFTGATSAETAFRAMAEKVPNVVVTAGSSGAWVKWNSLSTHVPAFACEPRDVTGAGDMFAGAFLYGVTNGLPADKAGRAACYLAKQVISQIGPRLESGTREFWDACLAGQV